MPEYSYRARDRFGQSIAGVMIADAPEAVAQKLKQLGYLPITIGEKKTSPFIWQRVPLALGRIRRSDLNLATRQLATLQKAGIPLLVSLQAVSEEVDHPRLRRVWKEVAREVETGSSLSEALKKHPSIFNNLYVQMVRAGETGGMLDTILERLALLGEHDEETEMQIRTATQYPLLVLSAILLAFVFLMTFVVPKFAVLFGRFGTALPLPTRIILGVSLVLQHYWPWLLILLGLMVWAFQLVLKTPFGRENWDRLILKTPVIGMLLKKVYLSRFTRIVGMLAQGGVPIVETLQVASGVVGNKLMERAIQMVTQGVTEGKGFAEPMRVSKAFPPLLVHMVKVGEESGKIDELLLRASEHYDSQVAYMIKHLGTLIEPLLLFVLGGMVLLIALGVFLPMWNLISLFRH